MLVQHLFCRPRPVCKSLKKKEISKLTSYTAATIPHTKSINPLKLKLLMWFHRKKPAVASSGPSEFTAWGKYGKLFLLVSGCFLPAHIPAGAGSVQSLAYIMTCRSVGYRVRFPRGEPYIFSRPFMLLRCLPLPGPCAVRRRGNQCQACHAQWGKVRQPLDCLYRPSVGRFGFTGARSANL